MSTSAARTRSGLLGDAVEHVQPLLAAEDHVLAGAVPFRRAGGRAGRCPAPSASRTPPQAPAAHHAGVEVARHARRLCEDQADRAPTGRARGATAGLTVNRLANNTSVITFAGTAGRRWAHGDLEQLH